MFRIVEVAEYMAELSLDDIKNKIKDLQSEKKIKEDLMDYLSRQEDLHYNASINWGI